MGIFDKFKSIYDQSKKKTTAPKHVVKDGDAKKKQFMSVGSADEKKKDVKAEKGNDVKKETSKEKKQSTTGTAPRVLIRPIITEKLTLRAGTYAFEVDSAANRSQVKAAIYHLYGVRPTRVNIVSVSGKAVRYGRASGFTKFWKKAVVTLPAGKSIEVFES